MFLYNCCPDHSPESGGSLLLLLVLANASKFYFSLYSNYWSYHFLAEMFTTYVFISRYLLSFVMSGLLKCFSSDNCWYKDYFAGIAKLEHFILWSTWVFSCTFPNWTSFMWIKKMTTSAKSRGCRVAWLWGILVEKSFASFLLLPQWKSLSEVWINRKSGLLVDKPEMAVKWVECKIFYHSFQPSSDIDVVKQFP